MRACPPETREAFYGAPLTSQDQKRQHKLSSESTKGVSLYFQTKLGGMVLGNSLDVIKVEKDESVDLIMTSPPFGRVRKKEYGNVDANEYVDWFRPFATEFKRVLKPSGSFVLDIGGAWNRGQPTRNLYHFKLLIMLCEEIGLHLAQEFYWWNPSKLPTPAEWVTVQRIRVKDAVNCVFWLSPSPRPKASNRHVLQPYSDSMRHLLKNGYKAKKRPSGHNISEKFGIEPHPAPYPAKLPEFFVRMLTDAGDTVLDPFAGSCVTGEVCERLGRRWICIDMCEEYLKGGLSRFYLCPT